MMDLEQTRWSGSRAMKMAGSAAAMADLRRSKTKCVSGRRGFPWLDFGKGLSFGGSVLYRNLSILIPSSIQRLLHFSRIDD